MNENLTLLSTDSSDLLTVLFTVVIMALIPINLILLIIIIRRMRKRQKMLEQQNAITLHSINRMSGNIIVISGILVIWELYLILDTLILCLYPFEHKVRM